MERKLTILSIFFEKPTEGFQIRELARHLSINHTTIRQYLNKLIKEELLIKKDGKPYPFYFANINKKFLTLKQFYNLDLLRKSELIEFLEDKFDFPTIILFGSFAKALDDQNSDIDIFILSNIKKTINLKKFEKFLNRPISLHLYNNSDFSSAKLKNSELINSICNGITLSGDLEII